MIEDKAPAVTRRPERRLRQMPHVKLDYSQPETLFEVLKAMDLPEGGELEIERVKDGVLLKPVTTTVDDLFAIPKGVLPPAPSYEERMRIFETLQGNATDDSEDIDIDFIVASRTSKETTISFDE
ncbi:hypothetical protein HY772_07105 [Candidatus Woesearchaeota archaeon]|nr:hypothetical protein [Candidatus Woesearchaeota archaeon]